MRQTRHKSLNTLRKYIRDRSLFRDNPAAIASRVEPADTSDRRGGARLLAGLVVSGNPHGDRGCRA
jgi:hypothetical protein